MYVNANIFAWLLFFCLLPVTWTDSDKIEVIHLPPLGKTAWPTSAMPMEHLPETNQPHGLSKLCDWRQQAPSKELGVPANLGIYLGAFLGSLAVFVGLQKLARTKKFFWITKIFSDGWLNGDRNADQSSFWLYFYHQIWSVSIENLQKIGRDGYSYLLLFKIILVLLYGIGAISQLFVYFNHQEGAFSTGGNNESSSHIPSTYFFSNMNETSTNWDVGHSTFNVIFFIVASVFTCLISPGLKDSKMSSLKPKQMLIIWDILEWGMVEKDTVQWAKELFPGCCTITLISRRTGKKINVLVNRKDLAVVIEFGSNQQVQSSYNQQKENPRPFFKLGLVKTISVDDLMIENCISNIERPWLNGLTFVLVISAVVILDVTMGLLLTYSTYRYIGGIMYPYIRMAIAWVIGAILNTIPTLLSTETKSKKQMGHLLTTIMANSVLNLLLPMLKMDDGVDLFRWLNGVLFDTKMVYPPATHYLNRSQCIFRPSLDPQLINHIMTSNLIFGNLFSVLRIPIILQCGWFHLKKTVTGWWYKLTKKQDEPVNTEEIKWHDDIEFDLGTRYGSLLSTVTVMVVAGTILTPIMVYPIGLLTLTLRYFIDKHAIVHTYKSRTTDPYVHKMAICFTPLPFLATAGALTFYNAWRNQERGQVVSMASTIMAYGTCAVIFTNFIVVVAYISYYSHIKTNRDPENRMMV